MKSASANIDSSFKLVPKTASVNVLNDQSLASRSLASQIPHCALIIVHSLSFGPTPTPEDCRRSTSPLLLLFPSGSALSVRLKDFHSNITHARLTTSLQPLYVRSRVVPLRRALINPIPSHLFCSVNKLITRISTNKQRPATATMDLFSQYGKYLSPMTLSPSSSRFVSTPTIHPLVLA
ncbi:hypothetical protein M422DRAFT_249162 [Sphaerobolus stellatus SS14]|nr:hypothetical protein M422DRAFT_249162 [Sphaerobolus stellatus SS14]